MADSEDMGMTGEEQLDSLDQMEGGEGDVGDNGDIGELDANHAGAGMDDPELEAIKARVREMEEEAEKLKQLQSEVDKQMNMGSPPGIASPLNMSLEDKMEVDNRSIYVGNVDYGATAEELEQHFHGCGSINRVTILCNKFDGHPKGFAYIEFAEKESVQTAMAMDESLFRGRQIKVNPKRTNRPGMSITNRGPRGRGLGRGGRVSRGSAYFGYRPMRRPRSYRRASFYPY
ncbi:polyadenylate-binding protein 2 [Thrips palmi]|uniref:Polyadenylate-binding protein 2 n=1 Tax=Thrips palmi TaxID=161013 RepID=A0A6P8YCC3_THRPL|nr:polyadenylate-binding protein 2 [Thrips palmi]XP_034237305.1 polyadenylate-binding protein 2 [Thrips palmi]XP_034237306.1 polyadenylate-binding protein 2 [Thrips palmi]XP_034237307.1 polyadenylate-binding protein 2 [Thrips palmi]XP_034237308.1 polyadenylate-binding protein 2 [Thrips palmi]